MAQTLEAHRRARREVVPPLFLATALRACPDPFLLPNQADILADAAVASLALPDVTEAAWVMEQATNDVKRLVDEIGPTDPANMLLTVATTVCMVHASRDDCPPAMKLALEILLARVLEPGDCDLGEAVQSASNVTLLCNQLHEAVS